MVRNILALTVALCLMGCVTGQDARLAAQGNYAFVQPTTQVAPLPMKLLGWPRITHSYSLGSHAVGGEDIYQYRGKLRCGDKDFAVGLERAEPVLAVVYQGRTMVLLRGYHRFAKNEFQWLRETDKGKDAYLAPLPSGEEGLPALLELSRQLRLLEHP
jgi:hypothetical protein